MPHKTHHSVDTDGEALIDTELQGPRSRNALYQLDRILRGDMTRPGALRKGVLPIDASSITVLIIVLGFIYGACMGCYALFRQEGSSPAQFLMTIGKVPLLFGLTFLITFPSLYVFNALVGSRLSLRAVGQLVVSGLAVMLTILASLGPIVAFFSLSTTSYRFMLLLNVAIFTVAGLLGLRFLLITLHRLTLAQSNEDSHLLTAPVSPTPTAAPVAITTQPSGQPQQQPQIEAQGQPQTPGEAAPIEIPDASTPLRDLPDPWGQPTMPQAPPPLSQRDMGALDRQQGEAWGRSVGRVFMIWTCVFGLVGSQMAWVLRPFLGAPTHDFALFRMRDSSFFEALWRALGG
jgi:hypothetical protein